MSDRTVIMQPQAAESDTLLGAVDQKTFGHYRVEDGRIPARCHQSYLRLKGSPCAFR